MPIYIVKANFYYPYGAFSEGDKRMHMSKVIEAGTKFSSEANEYISELLRSGIIEEYREVVSETVLSGGSSGFGGIEERGASGEKSVEKREVSSEKRDKEKK
jgi:hypothetical protein